MLKRAYNSAKRERDYLEEVLNQLDEEKDARNVEGKGKEKGTPKQEKGAEKSWS